MTPRMHPHDPLDDDDALRAVRAVHQEDRMPAGLREQVLRRAGLGRRARAEPAGGALAPPGTAASPSALPLPLARAVSRLQRVRGAALAFGAGAGLLAAAGLAVWVAPAPPHLGAEPPRAPLELDAREYGADELRALGARPGLSDVRVVGTLVQGSLKRLPPLPPHRPIRCGFHFHLRARGVSAGEGIHIEYARCRAPEGLVDDEGTCVEVAALGTLMSDGRISARRITPRRVPCPPGLSSAVPSATRPGAAK